MKNKNEKTPISFKIGLGIFILIVLVSLFANFLAPYDPFTQIPEIRLSKPSSANLFGTDQYGRISYLELFMVAEELLPHL